MHLSNDPVVWAGAICTLALFTFLYKENVIFRVMENVFVGFAAGHAIVLGYEEVGKVAVEPLIGKGDYLQLVPLGLGVLLYARYIKKYRSVASIPAAMLYGLGAATALRGMILAQVTDQVAEMITIPKSFNEFILLATAVLTLVYFVFTFSHVPAMEKAGRLGRLVMMVAFGAQFGNYVMGRAAVFIGRINFLLSDWLGLVAQ